MGIYQHKTSFAGKPVVDWDPEQGVLDPSQAIYRVGLSDVAYDSDEHWTDRFATLLDHPAAASLTGLVVGVWEEAFEEGEVDDVVEALVAARDRLPQLRALFMGDIILEECEISWIQQTDLSPLLDAYPQLEHFGVRGATGLSLGTLRYPNLKSLVIESGGLGAEVVRAVAAADLPNLEHLELWLGTPDYGGDATVEDLAPILAGNRFPRLRYLGLRDSEIADEIAVALAQAPILERISMLDLSLGTLGDEGALALLASPALARLQKLDIHHHYCSDEVMARVQALGIEVDVSEQEEADEDMGRYVAVSE